jgi:hypothetical protein
MTDLTRPARMCAEAAGELAEATERIIRLLLAGVAPGPLADAVYSVIGQAKSGVVLLEQAAVEFEVAAGRPPGTGPRGHYHDPAGKYNYCDDPACPRLRVEERA